MKVRKAVIAVAGFGTRFLPTTKAIPKEMLPIIDKPIVQYIAEELSASGIEEIIFVTNWQKSSIEDHFDTSYELEHRLMEQGKEQVAADLRKINKLAKFVYVRQVEGYGNALPVVSAKELIGDEPFIYAFGDDLVKSSVPFAQQLIDSYNEHGHSVIGVQEVAPELTSKYGVVKLQEDGITLADIVEKPAAGTAPSNLAVFGRYLFTPEIFEVIRDIGKTRDNEYWLTDAIHLLVERSKVTTKKVEGGRWLTTGDPATYLEAILEYSSDIPELVKIIKDKAAQI